MSRTRGGSRTKTIIDTSGFTPSLAETSLELKEPPPFASLSNPGLHRRLINQWRPLFPQIVFDLNTPLMPHTMERFPGGDVTTKRQWDVANQKYGWWMPAVFPLDEEFYVEVVDGARAAISLYKVEEKVVDVYERGLLRGRFVLGEINWPIKSPALTAYCHAFVWVQQ